MLTAALMLMLSCTERPYCAQPIFAGAKPIIANVTILNGMGVIGWLDGPPQWEADNARNGDMIDVSTTYSERLWPWAGWLGVRIGVSSHPAARNFDGVAEGVITLTVLSHPQPGSDQIQSTRLSLPLRVQIIKPPARQKRILWDQFHSLAYPAGYFPRDDLQMTDDPLDWNGDHPHTNFKATFSYLRQQGYFVDVLDGPFSCFDAHDYGTLLIIDPEEEYFDKEILKLKTDVGESACFAAPFHI